MSSLSTTLRNLSGSGHLPGGFQASHGIRALFPRAQNGEIKVSLLQKYLYSQTGQRGTDQITVQFNVGADGAGNWALWGNMTGGGCKWGAGFVFQFSDSSSGHGFIATGDFFGDSDPQQGEPPSIMYFGVSGFDPWIRDNWPRVFSKSVFLYVSDATGLDSLPDTANAATENGFAGLAQLQGATALSTSYKPEGSAGGAPGGSSGLGGVDWDIPPTGDDDGGA